MSRTVAKIIHGMAGAATLPLNRRQKDKTLARVCEDITRQSIREVITSSGNLKFYALRGAYTASAIERFGEDEPETMDWIETHIQPGETMWDIGANIGIYSLYAALRGVNVLAFEPSGLNFGLLIEHIQLNRLDNKITPLCVALGPETKLERLHMGDFSSGHASNALGQAETQFKEFMPVFSQGVPAFTAEDFCKIFNVAPPDHIKLDVDGIEDLILKGAAGILSKVKTITIEVEGDNAINEKNIEGPIFAAGFKEEPSHRESGSARNRLYINESRG